MIELGLIDINEWPWGKHKGKAIEDIPTDYLVWVVYDSDIGGMPLKKAMAELDKREETLSPDLGNMDVPPDNDSRVWGEDVW
jgi:hypothetical protein